MEQHRRGRGAGSCPTANSNIDECLADSRNAVRLFLHV